MPSANANPGSQSDGSILLPNGWRVAPAGKMLAVGTLPLNLVTSPDGRYAIITNNGIAKPSFSIVDLANWTVKNTVPVENAFLGLAWSADGSKLYSSGGGLNNVQEFSYIDGTLTRARTMALPAKPGETLAGGVAMSRDGRTLYATRVFAMTLSSIDVASGQVSKTIALPAEPYTCIVSPDGRTVYVSLWGDRQVRGYSTDSLTETMVFRTGEHPSAMAISADGRRLFVASANSGVVNVIDTFSGESLEDISTTLYPNAPRTSTPSALALSPDGNKLLVAASDLNAIAVVDTSNSARSFVDGFIPTAWYPTGVAFSRDGKQILILSGKGMTPLANPLTGGSEKRLVGLLSMVPTPDRVTLADMRIPGAGREQKLQGRRAMSAGQTDLAPTLLALFGFDASGLAYVGRDLLGRPDGPVLRPYGEWLNSHYLFTTRATAAVCRDLTANRDVANACDDIDRDARRARAISRLVVETDLQERLRDAASVSR